MCYAPIPIDNPNRGCTNPVISLIKDTVSHKIAVPCGHCPSCLALKQNYFVQRMETESLDNNLWTGMLSYNNKMMPRAYINGYQHAFADSRDIQLLMRRLRNDNILPKGVRYWFVSERGEEKHRPHWHFMLSTPKSLHPSYNHIYTYEKYLHKEILARWYTNIGSKRNPIKIPNLTYYNKNGRRNYDFHYLDPALTLYGSDDVSFYNSKYLLKDDKYSKNLKSALFFNCNEVAFTFFWKHLKNKSLSSHYLGDVHNLVVRQYIQFCIEFSYDNGLPFPCFINPNTGQTFPLAPYFKKKFFTVEWALAFRQKHDDLYIPGTGIQFSKDINLEQILKKYKKFDKVLRLINARDIHSDFYFDNTDLQSILDYGPNQKDSSLLEVAPDNWQSDFFD